MLGISARSHVGAATLRRALERMDAAWQGEEHMAKLSVNAMIGLWARSTEVVYSVRSSSSELDGAGADFSQAFAYEGGMVWDFVYARRLLSNGNVSHMPARCSRRHGASAGQSVMPLPACARHAIGEAPKAIPAQIVRPLIFFSHCRPAPSCDACPIHVAYKTENKAFGQKTR